ncbi:type II toxin-antitoxin system HicA family toxin [Nitrospira sp. Kam-Ns4a]
MAARRHGRSHRQFKHPTKPGHVTVSGHPGDDMPKGTLASVESTRIQAAIGGHRYRTSPAAAQNKLKRADAKKLARLECGRWRSGRASDRTSHGVRRDGQAGPTLLLLVGRLLLRRGFRE